MSSPFTGLPTPEVIPVRGVDHVLVLERRIAAGQLRDDVLRIHRPHRLLDRHRRREPSGTGLNSRVRACAFSFW